MLMTPVPSCRKWQRHILLMQHWIVTMSGMSRDDCFATLTSKETNAQQGRTLRTGAFGKQRCRPYQEHERSGRGLVSGHGAVYILWPAKLLSLNVPNPVRHCKQYICFSQPQIRKLICTQQCIKKCSLEHWLLHSAWPLISKIPQLNPYLELPCLP